LIIPPQSQFWAKPTETRLIKISVVKRIFRMEVVLI
jgi:hypothetical protein